MWIGACAGMAACKRSFSARRAAKWESSIMPDTASAARAMSAAVLSGRNNAVTANASSVMKIVIVLALLMARSSAVNTISLKLGSPVGLLKCLWVHTK